MRKYGNKLKYMIIAALILVIFFAAPTSAVAYYCTTGCYQVCGKDPALAGQCSLYMSCPSECDGHKAEACYIVESEPTCTTGGRVLVQHCVAVGPGFVCHKRDVWEEIPPLGHDFGPWEKVDEETHKHTCRRCGLVEKEKHTFGKKTATAYQDIGDKHKTTYQHVCTKCTYSYNSHKEEAHQYNAWKINSKDKTTASHICKLCDHTQNEWIGINIDPIGIDGDKKDIWTAEEVTVSGYSKFWNDCDNSTLVSIKQALISAKNLDTNSTNTLFTLIFNEDVSSNNGVVEVIDSREGRYKYAYEYKDSTGHTMTISEERGCIDHTPPQIKVTVTTGGKDDVGTTYTDQISFTNNVATHASSTGAVAAETKWTNSAPTITAVATDYFKDTSITGSGVHSVIIYDDEGHIVGANLNGSNTASYTLTYADEGTHTFTIVATDKLCRDAYMYGDATIDPKSVYNATEAYASKRYKTTDWIPGPAGVINYDVNHVTVSYVTTHYDCTAPVILGPEDASSINVTEGYYIDKRTVLAVDNHLNEYINDYPSNSLNEANDSSDIAKITITGVYKDKSTTLIASASRKDASAYKITQLLDWIYTGGGFSLPAANRSYAPRDLIPVLEDSTNGSVTRSSSSISYINLNTDPRYDINDEKIDPLTKAIIEAVKEGCVCFEIRAVDNAGNYALKNVIPEYAELLTIHTTIDPSTYKDPVTGQVK